VGGTLDVSDPVLLVHACDFGWGSIGKMRLILDKLGDVAIAVDPGASNRELTEEMLDGRHRLVDASLHAPTLALVVNEPAAAEDISARGVPVVYVDSLPYLWRQPHEVPSSAAVYCVQRYPGASLHPENPLSSRADLTWVDAIVPPLRGRRNASGTVVNVGGLHSHMSGSASDAYVRLVLVPAVELLTQQGHDVSAVCGNISAPVRAAVERFLPGVPVGRQTPYDFEATLRTAAFLVTSPGSTTILQAAALGLPTMLLPPQNLSQVLNVETFASHDTHSVAWPAAVLHRDEVERLRPQGEDVVLGYLYGRIVAAAESATLADRVRQSLTAAVKQLASTQPPGDGLREIGTNGAAQVARVVRQGLLAPIPVSAPAVGGGETVGRDRS
jgi:hydroxymethylcytosylglucuronate/cytosylglucuronate synthase